MIRVLLNIQLILVIYCLLLLNLIGCTTAITKEEEANKPSEIYCRTRAKHVEWCRSEVAKCRSTEEFPEPKTGTILVIGRDCGSV